MVRREIDVENKENVNQLIQSANETYYSCMITESSDKKTLLK